MRGVQTDESHAGIHTVADALHILVRDLPVRHMPPPDEHVGFRQYLLGKPLLRVVQAGEPHADIRRLREVIPYCGVHSPGIYLRHRRLLPFVAEFVPYKYSYHVPSLSHSVMFSAERRM